MRCWLFEDNPVAWLLLPSPLCYAEARCRLETPELRELQAGHHVACHRAEELALAGVTETKITFAESPLLLKHAY